MTQPTMRAAVIAEPGKVRIDDVPLPVPARGQVRIRLEGCGVCAAADWLGKLVAGKRFESSTSGLMATARAIDLVYGRRPAAAQAKAAAALSA